MLVDELGIEPSIELRQLHEAILAQDATLHFAPATPATADPGAAGSGGVPTNLPVSVAGLVGRTRERAVIHELLAGSERRIVSITGIGGIGKTRLALAIAVDLLDETPGGAFLVRLAGIGEPEAILPMIAEALGIAGESDESLYMAVTRRLRVRRTLLILDNFEQLTAGAPVVAQLVADVQPLRVLITSQLPLRVVAEQVFWLGPLRDEDAADLFVERARARMADFQPTTEEHAAIEQICARLDGTPLAIELAAARVGSLGAIDLAQRMDHPLAILSRGEQDRPERHRSLRAAIDWTYALLTDPQRSLFERFSVCAGPVSLATVEAIADPTHQAGALDDLDTLVGASLVRTRPREPSCMRFFMPQALRDYALERLDLNGSRQSVHERLAHHVADVAHAARLWKFGAGPDQQAELRAISEEIRPVVAWSRHNAPQLHVRLCAALAPYWVYRGHIAEVTEELAGALTSGLGSVTERAWVQTFLAKCVQLAGDEPTALELADQSLAKWRMLNDETEYALGTGDLTWIYRWSSRLDLALELTEDGLRILRHTGNPRLILRGLLFLAHVLIDLEDFDRAHVLLHEADQLAGGDASWELEPAHADCALASGDIPGAITHCLASLAWSSQRGEAHQVVIDTLTLASALAHAGHNASAIEVRELAELQRRQAGRTVSEPNRIAQLDHAMAHARQQVGPRVVRTATTNARGIPSTLRTTRALRLGQRALDDGAGCVASGAALALAARERQGAAKRRAPKGTTHKTGGRRSDSPSSNALNTSDRE